MTKAKPSSFEVRALGVLVSPSHGQLAFWVLNFKEFRLQVSDFRGVNMF